MKYFVALLLSLCVCFACLPMVCLADQNQDVSMGEPDPSVSPEPSSTPGPTPPTQDPSPLPEPGKAGARLQIDNKNLYENMEKTYAQGYMPTIKDCSALVVLPLLCDGELAGGSLRARAGLGENGPFVAKNYEKTVALAQHKVNGGKASANGYLVDFSLQLKSDRVNGSYPVTVSVFARDSAGGEVQEDFTVYVTIRDGKDSNATDEPVPQPEPTPEPVVLGPKVLVKSCRVFSLAEGADQTEALAVVNAGSKLRVSVTLANTSKTEVLENMAVTAAAPEGFALISDTDSVYIERLAAGGTVEVAYDYSVSQEVPAGQHAIALSYDFAYNKGATGSGTGTARVNISQPLEMEFSLGQMPSEAVISDTVEVNVQAINLSRAKAYNVRAVIEADGLSPSGTALIGDLEGGTSGEKPLAVAITGLTGSDFPYGQSNGTITYFYEDAEGQEYNQTSSFTVNIKSPFSEESKDEPENPGQWWTVMAIAGAAALSLGVALALREVRRRKG